MATASLSYMACGILCAGICGEALRVGGSTTVRRDSDSSAVVGNLWQMIDEAGVVERPKDLHWLNREISNHVNAGQPLFMVVDMYKLLSSDSRTAYVVLGEGLLPSLTFTSNTTFRADLWCAWELSKSTLVEVQLMRQRDGEITYTDGPSGPALSPRKVFSDNGDVFRTHYIICRSDTEEDRLKGIQSADGSLLWSAPAVADRSEQAMKARPGLSVCLAPIYGNATRWFIEWMEYHRQLGVSHVFVPINDSPLQAPLLFDAARHFARQGFATLIDWSDEATGWTVHNAYERGKWPAWSSCYLRNRGLAEWLTFVDLDEIVALPEGALAHGLSKLKERALETGKIGFAMQSVTVTSVLDHAVLDFNLSSKLLLDEFQETEQSCTAPFNCGEFHRGRQKYILHTGDRDAPLVITWTHAVSRDYEYARSLMEQVPPELFHVRHYQAHWYKNHDGTSLTPEGRKRKFAPIRKDISEAVRQSFSKDEHLMQLYTSLRGGSHVWGHAIRGSPLEQPRCTAYLRSRQSAAWMLRGSGPPEPFTSFDFTGASGEAAFNILKIDDFRKQGPLELWGADAALPASGTSAVSFEYSSGSTSSWKDVPLVNVTAKLDAIGYDCYLGSRQKRGGGEIGKEVYPALFLITGGCLDDEIIAHIRGPVQLICAQRSDPKVASVLRSLAPLL